MKAKIEWYQEVLELEPSSKVFFPLARLLAENGQPAEAVKTLRVGLDRHPEFFEARLLLIELLHTLDSTVDRDSEVLALSRVLSSYPRFWDAWSACAESGQSGRDVALALRFIAASHDVQDLSFAAVLDMGLRALAGNASGASRPEHGESMAVAGAQREPASRERGLDDVARVVANAGVVSNADEDGAMTRGPLVVATEGADDASLPATRGPLTVTGQGLAGRGRPAGPSEAEEDTEEPFSLRTRSMAEVLAEQGDTQGALDIYQELLATADSAEAKSAIARRIDELRLGMGPAVPGAPPPVAVDEPPLQGKHKLLHMLEMLAERLETRAQS